MAQKRNRKIHGFTLSDKTAKMVEQMADFEEISKSQVVEQAIRRMYRKWLKEQQKEGGEE